MPKQKEKTYPLAIEGDDYFFATKDEEEQGIKTKTYANGSTIKELTLSNGRVAVIRKLKGRDMVETKKKLQNDNSLDFETSNMAEAVSFDDKKEPPEYYLDDLYQDDYAKLLIAYSSLNFQ